MLLGVSSRWALSGSNTDENTELSAGPFVYDGFVEGLRCGIESARAFVDKYILSDLNRFES